MWCSMALVANAGFFASPDEDLEVEVGDSVCQRVRRRGIATAAVAEVCHRDAALGCSSVRARVRRDNIGSIKALEQNGFVEAVFSSEREHVLLRRSLK
jgi:RimJ/RimL family protein N-acetyltransferase